MKSMDKAVAAGHRRSAGATWPVPLVILFAGAVSAAGEPPSAEGKGCGDWPQWGGTPDRNMVAYATGLPDTFDPGPGVRAVITRRPGAVEAGDPPGRWATVARPEGSRNVKWRARLGGYTFGNPTVSGGRIFVGTNNAAPRDPKYDGDRNVLMCFREDDGKFLWQLVVPKIPKKTDKRDGDCQLCGLCASPTVVGDRVYVTTNRGEVLCLDVHGLANGNDGPFRDEPAYLAQPRSIRIDVDRRTRRLAVAVEPGEAVALAPTDADIVWRYDMVTELSVSGHDATNSSVLPWGNRLYVATSNGRCAAAMPDAPSLIVLDAQTGRLLAVDDAGIGRRLFHGQWSSPSMGVVNGRPLVFYGGGDGFCYAFDAKPVASGDGRPGLLKEVWRFDANPGGYRVDAGGKAIKYDSKAESAARNERRGFGPSEIIATPVFHDNRVYVAIGQDPRHGRGDGCLSCIDATQTGDITETGRIWQATTVDRSISTVSVADGLVYCADLSGTVHCLDARDGRTLWTHNAAGKNVRATVRRMTANCTLWGSTLVADGKVYAGTESRRFCILEAGREKQVLAEMDLRDAVCTTPIVANGVLYVATYRWLYALSRLSEERSRPQ